MKKIVLFVLIIFIQNLLNAQCICNLAITTTKKNAVANCINGSITANINGNLCGSLTLITVTLVDSSTSAIIETQYISDLPCFVFFDNVPAGSYKIAATHPCSPPASTYQNVPLVISDPYYNYLKTDVYAYGCNDGTIGIEIPGDYCPATLNILAYDTLSPNVLINFTQTFFCNNCYQAQNLKPGVYKVDVSDLNNPVHYINYITIQEPPCNFYITANQGSLEACVNEKLAVHLLGDYCLSNIFSVRLYNSSMKLKDSIINQTLNDTVVHFYNVKPGSYSVIATYANSCTSSTTAVIKKFCPAPVDLSDSAVAEGVQLLKWSGYSCAIGYELAYRLKGTSVWQKIVINGAQNTSQVISGLTTGSIYQWRVKSICTGTKKSVNSIVKTFTVTSPNRLPENFSEASIILKPNPSTGIITVESSFLLAKMNQSLYNSLGELIFKRNNCLSSEVYDLSTFPKGMYLMKITSENNTITKKIVKY